MSHTDCQGKELSACCPKAEISLGTYIVFPAVAVLLGWGLRGYIGGGPFAALIPGAFLSLSLSLLLRHDTAMACQTALFCTVGLAFGGEMTYGQTLGLATAPETFWWGMLGVTLKGGIWGLLGGALLGAGLVLRRYETKRLFLACLLIPVTSFIGWKIINDPQLIYFSDPTNPREESWAGLLFATVVFLAVLYGSADKKAKQMPLRFALWGLVGGAIGFGGGTLFLVYGPSLPVPQAWSNWWKAMEFFFGFMLGVFFGGCAWYYRGELAEEKAFVREKDRGLRDLLWFVPVIIFFFTLFPILDTASTEGNAWYLRDLMHFIYTFVFLGGLCLILGLRSSPMTWQIVATLTVFHAVLDFNEWAPAAGEPNFSIIARALILVLSIVGTGAAVLFLQKRRHFVPHLFQLLLWACYGIACLKVFAVKKWLLTDADAGYRFINCWLDHYAIVPVFVIFTVSAVITALYICRVYDESTGEVSLSVQEHG